MITEQILIFLYLLITGEKIWLKMEKTLGVYALFSLSHFRKYREQYLFGGPLVGRSWIRVMLFSGRFLKFLNQVFLFESHQWNFIEHK